MSRNVEQNIPVVFKHFTLHLVSCIHENKAFSALLELLQWDGFFWEHWCKCKHHSSLPWQLDCRIGYPHSVTEH